MSVFGLTPKITNTTERVVNTHIIFIMFLIGYTILGFFGYGNDGDTYLMLQSGHKFLIDGVYQYSRPPGYFVPEIVIGASSVIGGHILSNFISSILGVASLYFFLHLLKKYFSNKNATLIVIIVGLNPYFIIAASSSMDYIYSLFFGLFGITLLIKKHFFIAALMFALAISSRLSNSLIIGIIYAYFLYSYYKEDLYKDMIYVFLSGFLALFLSMMLFIPSFLAADKTLRFFTYAIGDWGFFGYLSRFIYKNIYLFGLIPFFILVGMTAWSILKKNVTVSQNPLYPQIIVVGLIIIFVQELLFLKVPLEISYLLPLIFIVIPGFAIVVVNNRKILYTLLVFTVLYGFIINPDILNRQYNDKGNEAISADIGFFLRPGVVVFDVLRRSNSQLNYDNKNNAEAHGE